MHQFYNQWLEVPIKIVYVETIIVFILSFRAYLGTFDRRVQTFSQKTLQKLCVVLKSVFSITRLYARYKNNGFFCSSFITENRTLRSELRIERAKSADLRRRLKHRTGTLNKMYFF